MSTDSNRDNWFILHVLSGFEYKVRDTINKTSQLEELDQYIKEVLVPIENVSEVKKGNKTTTKRKFYPGYILLNLELYNEQNEMNTKLWHFICRTQSVISFLGGDKPLPLPDDEVVTIMAQIHSDEESVKPKINFELGEVVIIKEGAFANLEGVIEEIDVDRGKLKVLLSIFGRSTPVDLEYWQVERS